MATPKCSLSFHRISVDLLAAFAIGVREGIFNNATVFTTPPVLEPVFEAQITDYSSARSAYVKGGSNQKPAYEAAKDTLMGTLDQTADYVDSVANGDPNTILLAGYVPTKATGSDVPEPEQPTNITLTRGSTGVLMAECDAQRYVDAYICLMTEGAPPPAEVEIDAAGQLVLNPSETAPAASDPGSGGAVFDFKKPRKKKFMGLTPGIVYYFVFIGINARGVSPMSEVRSIMCG